MKVIFLILSMFNYFLLSAQDKEVKEQIDLIISIDGAIVKTISQSKIMVANSKGDVKSIPVFYHPGNLSLFKMDSEYILSLSDSTNLALEFGNYEYTKTGSQHFKTYNIKIGKNWLKQPYIVLLIYNTDKKQYRGKLDPIPGTNYTFELDYPGGQMLRVRKK